MNRYNGVMCTNNAVARIHGGIFKISCALAGDCRHELQTRACEGHCQLFQQHCRIDYIRRSGRNREAQEEYAVKDKLKAISLLEFVK